MNKLIPEFKECKMQLYNRNRIKIENFKHLLDVSDEFVAIDNYLIRGESLKIVKMDQLAIEVYGEIKEIILV